MATAASSERLTEEQENQLRLWLDRVTELVRTVDAWASSEDWATRTITKKMEDREVGDHRAPALLLQKETVRILLEPTGRSAPGAEATADLYLMPAYEDVVLLYFHEGIWKTDYPPLMADRLGISREDATREFTRETFLKIVEELRRDAA